MDLNATKTRISALKIEKVNRHFKTTTNQLENGGRCIEIPFLRKVKIFQISGAWL
jgi:hypothetical protein